MAARRKTTVYLDPEVLRAARVRAARTDRRDSDVVEDALRLYLGLAALDEGQARSDLSEQEALDLAYAEVHASRTAE
jgi:hypothetical protein